MLRKRIVLLTIFFLFPLLVFAKTPVTSNHSSHSFVKSFGPTVTCDNLWQVAAHFCKNTSLIRQQAMIALLKKNPHAFYKKNINGLMRGYWLKVPTYQEMKRISPIWARREVAQQNRAWKKIKASFANNPTPDQTKLSRVICPSKHNQYLPKRFYRHVIQDQKPLAALPVVQTQPSKITIQKNDHPIAVMPQTLAPVSTISHADTQNKVSQLKIRVNELQQTNAFLSQHVSDLLTQKKVWEQTRVDQQTKIQGLEQQLSLFTQRFGQQQSTTTDQSPVPQISEHTSIKGYLASVYDNTTVKSFLAKYPSLNNMLKDENLRVILTAVVGIVILLLIILVLKLLINLFSGGKKKEAVQEISFEEHIPFDEGEGEEHLKAYELPAEEPEAIEEPEPEETEEQAPEEIEEEDPKQEKPNNYNYLAGEDVVTSKLDLAHAYIDMGDFKSAREILNSVLSEGNEAQKQEAEELLKQIENK